MVPNEPGVGGCRLSWFILKGLTARQALQLDHLHSKGYVITSNKYGSACRIDRPDWREYMAREHAPWDPEGDGMSWVMCLGDRAADHYRRCYSRDEVTVPPMLTKYLKVDYTEYRE